MCIFCDIVQNKIPADKIYEDQHICVFSDIQPKADIHLLIIPKLHIENLLDNKNIEKQQTIEYLMTQIPHIARKLDIEEFRLISNCGKSAGQEVFHLHFHMLSGNIHF